MSTQDVLQEMGVSAMTIDDFERDIMQEKNAEIERKIQEDENRRTQKAIEEVDRLDKEIAELIASVGGAPAGPMKLVLANKQRHLQDARRNLSILIALTKKQREERAKAPATATTASLFMSATASSGGVTRRGVPPRAPPIAQPEEPAKRKVARTGSGSGSGSHFASSSSSSTSPGASAGRAASQASTTSKPWEVRKIFADTRTSGELTRSQRFMQTQMTSIQKSHVPHVGGTKARETSARGVPLSQAAKVDRKRKRSLVDDGDDDAYHMRLLESEKRDAAEVVDGEDDEVDEVELDGGLRLLGDMFDRLFDYQQVCLKWLWELHQQKVGGIIGDEMGLGKTVQLITYLEALRYSELLEGPVLIVCPATILNQWVREFQKWAPRFRVSVYHSSGSGAQDRKAVLRKAGDSGSVVITTYSAHAALLEMRWFYVVLDEGHLIKNPDSDVTLACKSLLTPHRIILSGSPIQNNLTELWSLFDFVFPGRLGTLPVFQVQFAVPIDLGGYTNATDLQVKTAYKCAVTLCGLIQPYLLRRMKKDVNAWLPAKTEQVLFCKLADDQLIDYVNFLKSEEVQRILRPQRGPYDTNTGGNINIAFRAIMILRKICNHPNLIQYTVDDDAANTQELVDNMERLGRLTCSGKMKVLEKLLEQWQAQGRKVLVFSQTRVMLDVIERFVGLQGYTYCRLDGNTPIKSRIHLIDKFNTDPDIFVALLTAKVGGVGINLIVLIYDPDWNPTTDLQARERAWRIGQTKDVVVYRLMTSGTIEEKIYHRQIFKQFLTEKILSNPDQKRFFKQKDLKELFTLGDQYNDTLVRLYKEENRGHVPSAVQREIQRRQQRGEVLHETAQIFGDAETAAVGIKKDKHRSKGSKGKGAPKGRVSRDLSTIDDCAHVEDYDSEKERAEVAKQENNLLKQLFDGGDLEVVMDHDKILDANHGTSEEKTAARVAQEAKAALKKNARYLQSTQKIGVPTWTGSSGSAGAPAAAAPKSARKRTEPASRPPVVKTDARKANGVRPVSNGSGSGPQPPRRSPRDGRAGGPASGGSRTRGSKRPTDRLIDSESDSDASGSSTDSGSSLTSASSGGPAPSPTAPAPPHPPAASAPPPTARPPTAPAPRPMPHAGPAAAPARRPPAKAFRPRFGQVHAPDTWHCVASTAIHNYRPCTALPIPVGRDAAACGQDSALPVAGIGEGVPLLSSQLLARAQRAMLVM